jgi:hypothetical protein
MARTEWTRWGRGDCEGYSLSIGQGDVRFHAGVSRRMRDPDGKQSWTSDINGRCANAHPTRADAMAHIEFELRIAAEEFLQEYESYKAHRRNNRFSQAVDAARNGPAQV